MQAHDLVAVCGNIEKTGAAAGTEHQCSANGCCVWIPTNRLLCMWYQVGNRAVWLPECGIHMHGVRGNLPAVDKHCYHGRFQWLQINCSWTVHLEDRGHEEGGEVKECVNDCVKKPSNSCQDNCDVAIMSGPLSNMWQKPGLQATKRKCAMHVTASVLQPVSDK